MTEANISPTVASMLGRQIGNVRILRPLGAGGYGTVFLAHHVFVERLFAVKVLSVELKERERVVSRFRREAQALAQLQHESIVHFYDLGVMEDIGFYLVMEYLKGESLQERIVREGNYSLPAIRELIKALCEALSYVHKQGVLHRDIKPGNIFLQQTPDNIERVKLIDFGIAAFLDTDEQSITRTGHFLGTAAYSPPEQIYTPKQADARSDLYALGVVLVQLLTGRLPFVGDTPMATIFMHAQSPPPQLADLVPSQTWAPSLEAFVQKAMAKSPVNRPESAEEFWRECERVLQDQENLGHTTSSNFQTEDSLYEEDPAPRPLPSSEDNLGAVGGPSSYSLLPTDQQSSLEKESAPSIAATALDTPPANPSFGVLSGSASNVNSMGNPMEFKATDKMSVPPVSSDSSSSNGSGWTLLVVVLGVILSMGLWYSWPRPSKVSLRNASPAQQNSSTPRPPAPPRSPPEKRPLPEAHTTHSERNSQPEKPKKTNGKTVQKHPKKTTTQTLSLRSCRKRVRLLSRRYWSWRKKFKLQSYELRSYPAPPRSFRSRRACWRSYRRLRKWNRTLRRFRKVPLPVFRRKRSRLDQTYMKVSQVAGSEKATLQRLRRKTWSRIDRALAQKDIERANQIVNNAFLELEKVRPVTQKKQKPRIPTKQVQRDAGTKRKEPPVGIRTILK